MVWYGIFWTGQLLVCTWRHGQKHFSPLGTKLYFNVNSSRKTSIVLTPNMAALSRGCNFSSPVLTIAPSIQRIFCFFFFHFTFHCTLWMKQQPVFSSVHYLRYLVVPCVKRVLMIRRLDGKENFRKKRFRRQNNKFACVSHFFIHFFAASAGLRFGGVEASPPQKNAPPSPPILLSWQQISSYIRKIIQTRRGDFSPKL